MGLDMYVYRVEKPGLDTTRVFDEDELDNIVLNENDINNPMYSELLPYCDKVRVIRHYYDFDKIKAEYGLSGVHISGIIGGTTLFSGMKADGQKIEISKSDKEINEEYTVNREEVCYVSSCSEVHYWRKEYDISHWFYEHIGRVENTGYYILNKELLLAFNKAFPEDTLPVREPDEESAYFYWEWY